MGGSKRVCKWMTRLAIVEETGFEPAVREFNADC
jgi:hypothetical protein